MSLLRSAVVAVTLLSFAGCATTMQPIENFTPSRIQEEVHVGDQVHLMATNGKILDLEVTKMESDGMYGRAENGKYWHIKYENIEAIEVGQVSGTATFLGAVGVVAVTTYVVAVAAVILFFRSLGGMDGGC